MLEDEGWQASLSEEARERVVARLEALLPAGTIVEPDRAAALRASVLALAGLIERVQAGTLDEATLVAAWLRHGVA